MIAELRQRWRAAKASEGLGYHRLGRKVGVDKMVLQRFLKGTTVPNGLHLERIRAYLDGAETVPEDEAAVRWLYAAAFGSHVKVGVSHRPQHRLLSLRQASPHAPVLLGKRRLATPTSLQEERDAHAALAPWHHRAEWFVDCEALRGALRDIGLLDGGASCAA